MIDALSRKKRENEPTGFAAWVRKNGATVSGTVTPDRAATLRAKSAPTYGKTAEQLFESGLQGSGYARFLADEASRGFDAAKKAYAKELSAVKEKNVRGYANYLSAHEKKQDTLYRQMVDRIGRIESLDPEVGYHLALGAGLTDENARRAAEDGAAAAKERITSRLLRLILEERISKSRVEEYARGMGFTDEEIERFGIYANKVNGSRIPFNIPETPIDATLK